VNSEQVGWGSKVRLGSVLLFAVLVGIAVALSGCSSAKVLTYGRPSLEATFEPTADVTSVAFMDQWKVNPKEYEVLGHLWFKGKADFSKSGPAEEAARALIQSQAAQLGANAVIGFATGNSTVWNGALYWPKPGLGIDTRWATGLAVRKLAPGSGEAAPHPPVWVSIMPILATAQVQDTLSADDLAAIKALLDTCAIYVLGEKGYHADVIPDEVAGVSAKVDIAPEGFVNLTSRVCPWSDYVLVFMMHHAVAERKAAAWEEKDRGVLISSCLFDVRARQWGIGDNPMAVGLPESARSMGGDLQFLRVTPSLAKGDGWNKSVVKLVKGAVAELPPLTPQ
jgi:hypothetical protein